MSLRSLYVGLLRLHPPFFRERFAAEMLDIFDECGGPPGMVLDAAISLGRQWGWRDAFRKTPTAAATVGGASDVPVFFTCGGDTPRPGPLMSGGVGALASFAFVSFLIAHPGAGTPVLIGSAHSNPSNFLGAETRAQPTDLNTETKVKPYPESRPLPPYFRSVKVLAALDTNRDGVISADEIERAGTSLWTLDLNRDGRLDSAECGARGGTKARDVAFMRTHPVLVALDSDGDYVISGGEIRRAPAALRTLDRDHDGGLSLAELLPDPTLARAINIVAELDRDGDRRISPEEHAAATVDLSKLLKRADRDHDGYVTEDELMAELLKRPAR